MAKKTKVAKKKVGGPFLAAAIFCESIIEDNRNVVSALGIIDGVQLTISPFAPPEMPSPSHPAPVVQNILLVFRTGDAPGKHNLKLVMQQPNGKRSELVEKEVELTADPNGGVHVKINVTLKALNSGVFWIDVILDNKRFTRMPINIQFQRAEMPSTAAEKKPADQKT